MPKHYELDRETRVSIGNDIIDQWDSDNNDRSVWLHDLPKWLEAYQGRPVAKDVPWEGASNLNVPITPTVIEAYHPRLMAALFKPKPMVAFRPQEPGDEDRATRRETFLDWSVREEVNLFPTMDRGILGMLMNGVQFFKITWDLQIRHVRDRHEFPSDTPVEQVIAALTNEEQGFVEAVNRVSDSQIEAIVKGRKVEFEVETKPRKLVIYSEREEVIRDAPLVTPIEPEDIAVNSDASYDLQKADHIFHRYFLTMDQIRREAKKGTFSASTDDLDELEKLIRPDSQPTDNTYDIKAARESVTGVAQTYREGNPSKLEIIDAYQRYDINDDGYEEEVIFTIPVEKPDIILRTVRLEDVYRHGMRPFGVLYFNPVGTSIWSIGIPQILEGLQIEFNTIHNQRVDAGELGNRPFGWYVPAGGLNPEKMRIESGYLYPVDDVNAVKMHTPANYTAWGFQEEQLLWSLVERRTKVSDLILGRIGETQGAARTAMGVQTLSSQQAAGFDIVIRRVQEGFKHILQQILALYAQYMPPGKEVRILGKQGEGDYVITRNDLTGFMDMEFSGNSLSTDKEVERNTTTFLAQSVLSPASIGMLLQLGITNPVGVAEWFRHILRVFDVPKLERIIMIPEMPVILKPDQVVNRVLQGERITPNQGEDHQSVIQALTEILNSPDMLGLKGEQIIGIQEQIKLRQQALQQEMMRQMMMQLMQQQMMAQGMAQGGQGEAGQGGPISPPGFGGAPPQLPQAQRGLAFGP